MVDDVGNQDLTSADDAPENGVVIGTTRVPFKTIQALYNEITGKTETYSKYYDDGFMFSLDDLHEFHHRITQTYSQYSIASHNYSINVYFSDNHKDTWSSFEKFQLLSAASTSSIESILFQYEFLVILPQTRKPQSYSLEIRFISRIAFSKRMRSEFIGSPPRFFLGFGRRTINIEIRYIDYNVARTFVAAIDEWTRGLTTSQYQSGMKWLQSKSHIMRKILEFLIVIFVMYQIGRVIPHFVTHTSDLLAFADFTLAAVACVYVAYFAAGFIARFIEASVDDIAPIAYISISKGDARDIEEFTKRNKRNKWKIFGGLLGTLLFSVLIEVTAILIVEYVKAG